MLRIRKMRFEDIRFAVKLSDQERWGIPRSDFERILLQSARGSFVACYGAKRVGLTTTATFGKKLAWIGNVIVDRGYRGEDVGQNLVQHALEYLQGSRVEHIGLYCFEETARFYEKLGFLRNGRFLRMAREAGPLDQEPRLSFQHPPPVNSILRADAAAFGADRSRLIRLVLSRRAGWYLGRTRGNGTTSCLMVKEYEDMYEYGPWVCINPQEDEPEEMLLNALMKRGDRRVEISCLRDNRRAIAAVRRFGFQVIKEGYRMYFDEKTQVGDDSACYALGFLDKG